METRPLTPDDLSAFRALWLEGLHQFPLAFLWSVEDVEAISEAKLIDMLSSGTRIGVFDGGLIGFAGVTQYTPSRTTHRATIGPFYVDPAHHGGGAAGMLLKACIDLAQTKGVWLIDLFVAADNPRAIRFYERHGFIREGRMPVAVIVDGVEYDDFYYCLTLPH